MVNFSASSWPSGKPCPECQAEMETNGDSLWCANGHSMAAADYDPTKVVITLDVANIKAPIRARTRNPKQEA